MEILVPLTSTKTVIHFAGLSGTSERYLFTTANYAERPLCFRNTQILVNFIHLTTIIVIHCQRRLHPLLIYAVLFSIRISSDEMGKNTPHYCPNCWKINFLPLLVNLSSGLTCDLRRSRIRPFYFSLSHSLAARY